MSIKPTSLPDNRMLQVFKLPSRRFVVGMIILFVLSIIGICILLTRLHYNDLLNVANLNLQNLSLIQELYNHEILDDIQELVINTGLNFDDDALDTSLIDDEVLNFTNDHPMFQTLLVLDRDGNSIFDSRSGVSNTNLNLADTPYFTVHQSTSIDNLYVGIPLQGMIDTDWSIPISYPVYRDGELRYVVVAYLSSSLWSRSFDGLDIEGEYLSVLATLDGQILTTSPYDVSVIGTSLSEQYLEMRDSANLTPSSLQENSTLIDIDRVGTFPIYSIIEMIDTETFSELDNVVLIITLIGIVTTLSGCTVLWLYLRQYRVLRIQTSTLYQTNLNLEQEIQQRKGAEQTLTNSEMRYRAISEIISDYAFLMNVSEDGRMELEWASDQSYTITGYSDADLFNKVSPIRRCHPDDVEQLRQDMERTIAGEDTVSEYRTRMKSGEYLWVRAKRRPIWDDELGRVTQFIGTVTDITVRKEAEIALHESEERYRVIAEDMSGYAFAIHVNADKSRTIDWVTNSFYVMFGYTPEEINAQILPMSRCHPDDREKLQKDVELTLAGEETITEYRTKKRSGDYVWIQVKRYAIWDETKKRVVRVIGVASDITARKEAELALRESEARYRTVTELISDYAFSTIVHEDGTRTREWLTESFYTMTGYGKDHATLIPDPIPRTHPDDLEQVEKDLARTFIGEETVSEYRWRIASGEYIWTRVKRRPIWNAEYTYIERIIGAVTNITAQKEVEIALQESEEQYRLVTELISDYCFSCIVHIDGSFDVDWITDSYYTMIGYPIDSEKSPIHHVHPEDKERLYHDLKLTCAGEKTVTEFRYKTQQGNYIWLRVERNPIWDDKTERVIRFIGAGSNITAEKEAEFALQQNEAIYREVSELMTDYAFSISMDASGQESLDWVIGSYEEITGKQDILTHGVNYWVNDKEAQQVLQDKQLTLRGQRSVSEYRIRNQITQNTHWLRVTRQPIWDDQQQRVIRYIGAATDITAQKEAELALQVSQTHYREVTELMSDYAMSVLIREDGIGGGLEWIAGAIEQTTGLHQDDVMKYPSSLSRLTHPEDKNLLTNDLERTLRGEKTKTEYRIIHAQTRKIVWLNVTRQPIWDKDYTHVERVIVVATDITSQKQAEFALSDSEERYRLVSELISDYVYSEKIYDDQSSEIEWIAGSLESIVGVSIGDVYRQGKIPLQIHPDDYMGVMEDNIATRAGNTIVCEYRVIHAIDETIHWVRESRRPIWDDDSDQVVRIISATSDITHEKMTEAALRDSENRYRILTDLMSDYVYSLAVKPDNRIEMEWFAGSFESITGLIMEKFQVQTLQDMTRLTLDEDVPQAQSTIAKTLEGESTTGEYRIINAVDKKPRWLRISRYPVKDEKTGRVIRIFGATTDITAQKHAELALRDSEERYRLLTELLTDYAFSIRIEPDGRLYREWLLGQHKAIMGYEIDNEGYLDEMSFQDNLDMMREGIEKTIDGQITVHEYEFIHAEYEKPRWIRVTRQPIWDRTYTRVLRYLGAVKDITLEKEAEVISREADQLRQELDREKGLHELRVRFVSMVTHEFRNPLAAIQSSVSILDNYADRLDEEKRQEKYQRIYGQIERLTSLLEDLLEIGELENYMLRFSPQRVDVIDLIANLYSEYRETVGSNYNLILNHDADKLVTYGDVKLLEQTFGNIISNAIKYSPEGQDVICTVGVQDQNIIVTVQDFGIGIPERDYDRLFKAFYRASNVSTQPGTGLGLIIAKQSIELHRGEIYFTSVLGEGTTFTVTLPQVIGDVNED